MAKRPKIYLRSETPGEADCPFTIVVDSREGIPYTFEGMKSNKNEGEALIRVKTVRKALDVADYQIEECPGGIAIERKSIGDLFGSMVDRDNMNRRLRRMNEEFHVGVWVIEAELSEIHREPASQYNPKALMRSVMAWTIRYPKVHWQFCPGRRYAEQWTFRLMEKYWIERGTNENLHGTSEFGECS